MLASDRWVFSFFRQLKLWLVCAAVSVPPPLLFIVVISVFEEWTLGLALCSALGLAVGLALLTASMPFFAHRQGIFQRAFKAGLVVRFLLAFVPVGENSGPPLLSEYVRAMDSLWEPLRGRSRQIGAEFFCSLGFSAYTATVILICGLLLLVYDRVSKRRAARRSARPVGSDSNGTSLSL